MIKHKSKIYTHSSRSRSDVSQPCVSLGWSVWPHPLLLRGWFMTSYLTFTWVEYWTLDCLFCTTHVYFPTIVHKLRRAIHDPDHNIFHDDFVFLNFNAFYYIYSIEEKLLTDIWIKVVNYSNPNPNLLNRRGVPSSKPSGAKNKPLRREE